MFKLHDWYGSQSGPIKARNPTFDVELFTKLLVQKGGWFTLLGMNANNCGEINKRGGSNTTCG